MTPMSDRKLRIGVIGLGRAFTIMLPTFTGDKRVQLVAAADPRADARERFAAELGGNAYAEAEALCADPAVEVVYIATPHQNHAEHTRIAATHGKHVVVEKPMALTLADCTAMIEATRAAGVHLIVARVYYTPSWIDGKECIVLDYSKTSLFARKIRDEIRLIDSANRLYLGKVWWGKTRLVDFALRFPQ